MAQGRELKEIMKEWLKQSTRGTRPGRACILDRKAGLGTGGREGGTRGGMCGPGVDPRVSGSRAAALPVQYCDP